MEFLLKSQQYERLPDSDDETGETWDDGQQEYRQRRDRHKRRLGAMALIVMAVGLIVMAVTVYATTGGGVKSKEGNEQGNSGMLQIQQIDVIYPTCGICKWQQNPAYIVNANIMGTVALKQEASDSDTVIILDASGFPRTESGGQHGFHVHELSDLSDGCNSLGGHYNPFKKDHGAPQDMDRHVGDLGNVFIDAAGTVVTSIRDSYVKLSGDHNVIGRSFVMHEDPDDFGLGGEGDSLTTGHAGKRLACCIIQHTDC